MPQFEQIDTFASQIFWLVLCFGVLYLFVSRVFVPRILAVQRQRHAHTQANLQRARELVDKSKALEAQAAADLAQAQQSIARALEQALAEFATHKAQVLQDTQQQLAQEFQAFSDNLAAQVATERVTLAQTAQSLAQAVAQRLVAAPGATSPTQNRG